MINIVLKAVMFGELGQSGYRSCGRWHDLVHPPVRPSGRQGWSGWQRHPEGEKLGT